jgi:hypothetical protein
MAKTTSEEMLRRVRFWLGKAEDALDQGAMALDSAGPLPAEWQAEYGTDVVVITDKVAKLNEALKRQS